jgi:hypothetical protein
VILHRGEDAQSFQIEISDKKEVLIRSFRNSNLQQNNELSPTVSKNNLVKILQKLSSKCKDNSNKLRVSIIKLSDF